MFQTRPTPDCWLVDGNSTGDGPIRAWLDFWSILDLQKSLHCFALLSWRQDTTELAREPVWMWDDLYCINSLFHSFNCAFSAHCFLPILDIAPLDSPPPIPTWSGTCLSFWSRQFRFRFFSFFFLFSPSFFYLSLPPSSSYPSFVICCFVLRFTSSRGFSSMPLRNASSTELPSWGIVSCRRIPQAHSESFSIGCMFFYLDSFSGDQAS